MYSISIGAVRTLHEGLSTYSKVRGNNGIGICEICGICIYMYIYV